MERTHNRAMRATGVAALLMTVAIAFGGCSSSSSTPAAGGNGTSAPSSGSSAAPTSAADKTTNANGGGLGGAVNAFSSIKSYQFSMTMKGGSYGSMFGSAPITGMIVVDPPAASMNVMGMEVREVGGKSFVNMGTSWTESSGSSTTSMADSLSPEKLFGSYLGADLAAGYKSAGEEQKNGVTAVHYVAGADVMNQYGSLLGVDGGTWTAEVWISKDGGYPVGMKLASTGGSSEFLMQIDITNINDPANVITDPTK
jgi:hypothetical protein